MSIYPNGHALVETDWLQENLGAPGVKILDGTWFLPTNPRDQFKEYEEQHIPGAMHFDIDTVCDQETTLPHMIPTDDLFAEKVGAMGIGNEDHVIVYDSVGGFSAAMRVWWTFRLFGHEKVSVLNGGLPKWLVENRPMESGPANPTPTTFTAAPPDMGMVRSADQVAKNILSAAETFVDARSPGRFAGTEPEPRPSPRRGRVPGSVNLPFGKLIDMSGSFTVKDAGQIRAAFEEAGLQLDQPMIASCGTGVTACVPTFAAFLLGYDRVAVYDGSWAEWGSDPNRPVED
ncbi:MAG: sulfurtransferase [Magnetospiraceae bacterium]